MVLKLFFARGALLFHRKLESRIIYRAHFLSWTFLSTRQNLHQAFMYIGFFFEVFVTFKSLRITALNVKRERERIVCVYIISLGFFFTRV